MGRNSLPLGDVGEWHRKKTRGPSFDGEGRGDGHDMRPTCRASTSSRLRRGLLGGNGLCGGLATSVAMGPFVAVSVLSVLWLSWIYCLVWRRTGLALATRSLGVRSCRRLPQVRAQVSLRGLPGWHSQSAQQNVRLTPTSVVASLHYRNSLKPSPNHRSRAGEERSERPGRNCGASAQTATRDLPSRESCLNLRARNLLELVPALRALRRRRALRHLLPKSQCGERLPEVSLLRREVEDGQAFGLAAQRRSQ